MLPSSMPADRLQSALDHSESDMRDVIQQADDAGLPVEERDITLARSCFALGWRDAVHDIVNRISGDEAFKLLTQTVKELDELAVERDLIERVAPIRNALVAFRNDDIGKRKDFTQKHLAAAYGPVAAALLTHPHALDDSAAFDLGLAVATTERSALFGFAMFSEDSGLRCKCIHHVSQELAVRNVTPEAAEEALKKRFPSRVDAVTQFGHWVHDKYVTALAPLYSPEGGDIAAIDSVSISEQSHGLFSRLLSGKAE